MNNLENTTYNENNGNGYAPENLPFKESIQEDIPDVINLDHASEEILNGNINPSKEDIQSNISNDDAYLHIPKSQLKTLGKGLIVVVIVAMALPRIIGNVSSTYETVEGGAQKVTGVFPTLTSAGSSIGSFITGGFKGIGGFMSDSLATVANVFYVKNNGETETISGVIAEEKSLPVRIIAPGINTQILNPSSTDLSVLEEALHHGVVRYPKSGLLGENDNVYIFGHSTSIKNVRNEAYTALNGLKNLREGDIIKVQSETKEYLYSVTSISMKKNSEASVRFNTGKRMLTVSTCNTLGAKEDRYIVEAEYIGSGFIAGVIPEEEEDVEEINTPESAPTPTPTPAPAPRPTPTPAPVPAPIITEVIVPSDPNGRIDLVANIKEVGIINTDSQFVATTTLKSTDKIAFKFTIKNNGTKEVEGWTFNAVLPTMPFYIYHSNTQPKLGPGASIEYTLAFDKPDTGKDIPIVVNVDPTRTIWEISEDNNIVKMLVDIEKAEE